MKKITNTNIEALLQKAIESPRKRTNLNLHTEYSDTLQRLFNAMLPGTYVRPHKHESPDKREIFTILKGSVLIIEFNNSGNIFDWCIISATSGIAVAEIAEKTWHTVIALEPSVVFEIKDGPYSPVDDKNFATWAPAEGDADTNKYISNLLLQLDLKA
jgi:cupin fold WbuC family metalloprotein